MDNLPHRRFPVPDRSYLNSVKRDISKLAESYGFSSAEVGRIDVIVSELASNLVKHTSQGGELLAKPFGNGQLIGWEVLSLDSGPGMHEPVRMMEDGVSTAGSMGQGLGAIRRMSDTFDLYSLYGNGTAILSRIYKGAKPPPTSSQSLNFRSVMVAKADGPESGDGWTWLKIKENHALLVLDGLGHGPLAHIASNEAIDAFLSVAGQLPSFALRSLHDSIRRTRGAVGAVVLLEPGRGVLTYCGVGNITCKLVSPEKTSNLISHNGILGHNIPASLSDHQYDWTHTSLLVMHSDGLGTKWDLSKYPGLIRHDPSLIAGVLYKDHTRRTDDTLVIVGKSTANSY
jgi:anti-sigma regulatory factor (Ser/Thr protein kinase)